LQSDRFTLDSTIRDPMSKNTSQVPPSSPDDDEPASTTTTLTAPTSPVALTLTTDCGGGQFVGDEVIPSDAVFVGGLVEEEDGCCCGCVLRPKEPEPALSRQIFSWRRGNGLSPSPIVDLRFGKLTGS
jgi:hypothetical protein